MKLFFNFLVVGVLSKQVYENYSFDYSAKKLPLAYTTYGNAVELNHKVKLNSNVTNRGGALVLSRPVAI